MIDSFSNNTSSEADLKETLDDLEIQLFRMQDNIKEIAKTSEVVAIEQTKMNDWTVVYAKQSKDFIQFMVHACSKPFKGNWDSAIQAEIKDASTIHIDSIKGQENKGFGSILLKHLKEFARKENKAFITGEIVERDFDHVDRLDHFYKKHQFNVQLDFVNQRGDIYFEMP